MFQGLRMMEANETADQFDELLSQLRIDEMNPVEVQESAEAALDYIERYVPGPREAKWFAGAPHGE